MASIDGIVSGLDTTSVVASLMVLERMPQTRLKSQQGSMQTILNAYRSLNTNVASLRDAAAKATTSTAWEQTKATSSNPALAGVSTTSGAATGRFTFTVGRLAAASTAVLSGSVAGKDAAVASGPVLLSKGAALLGVAALNQGATLAAGAHQLTVTQSSGGAVKTGSSPLATTTTIGPGNNTLDIELHGVATTLTLASGNWSPQDLAAEVTRASGGALTASVAKDGSLTMVTTTEGSQSTLRVVSAPAGLGLAADAAAITGVDGRLRLGADPASDVVLSRVAAGQTVVVAGANGDSVSLTLAGGLRAGEASLNNVAVGAGATLAETAQAINNAKAGVTATAVQVSPGNYRLQLSSTTTGAASELMLDGDSLASLGSLQGMTHGEDAMLTVGSASSGASYAITRPSNTITELLPGVTLNLVKADPASEVTIDIARDPDAVAARVSGMVEALNSVLSQTKALTSFDPGLKKGSMLMGDGMVRRLTSDVLSAATDATVVGTLTLPSSVGISVTREGALTFDKAKFLEAYAKDPKAVEALVGKGTAASPGIAGRVEELAARATRSGDGTITSTMSARDNEIKGLGERITAWDSRLATREAALRRQFSAMESAMGQMRSQGSWLTSQLAALR